MKSTGASKTANGIDYCLVEDQNLFGLASLAQIQGISCEF
jgi:hypothetical protein